ncbi:MAG: HAMP domain-containing sensor histidine kinase [Pseudomonadota bacterium]
MLRRFSLKTYVFLWVALVMSVPLVVLLVGATDYGRRLYAEEVRRDVMAGLRRTVAGIERRLLVEHDLVRGLSQVPVMRDYLPMLRDLDDGELHPGFQERTDEVTGFFQAFQGVRRSLGTVRVLDRSGDTLIKVTSGYSSPAMLENLDGVPLVESGSENPEFRDEVVLLPADDVGTLPPTPGYELPGAVLNTTFPLDLDGDLVGYLSIGAPLGPLDRVLDVGPRPRGASLLVAQYDLDDPERHGRVLYADDSEARLSASDVTLHLQDTWPDLLEEGFAYEEGVILADDGSTIYFRTLVPYPDRLANWIFAYRVDHREDTTPFWHAHYVTWVAVVLVFLLALLIGRRVARQVSVPVASLARGLVDYAEGKRDERLAFEGPPEVRKAGEAFNHMTDTLNRLQQERDRAQVAMVQNAKLASVGELSAGIGHELSNPLSNIYSLTKLVQRGLADDDPAQQDVLHIREEAERASRIVRGLLNFARQGPANPTRFEAAGWVVESVSLVQRMADARRVAMRVAAPESAWLFADRALLQQALVNVLINAVQASPEGGRVQVTLTEGDGETVIEIQDQGGGLREEVAERAFDPFFTTKAEGEGTGLGLSITLGIVERHGGRLTLQNVDGGALARMVIPAGSPGDGGSVEEGFE